MNERKMVNYVCNVLLIVGALNWGLVSLFQFDVVATLFGSYPLLARMIYMLVGLAGVYTLSKILPLSALGIERK